jgi:hypothetical protein
VAVRRIVLLASVAGALVIAAAIVFVLYVGGTFEPSLASQLRKVEGGAQPGWYLGASLDGLRLTDVEPASGDRVATFGYGECHRVGTKWNPFSATSCGFPLVVQTWRIQGATVSPFYVPTLADGTCARLTLHGVPAAVGPTGVVLYTGGEAVALIGPPDIVEGAAAALRPVGGRRAAALPRPTTDIRTALADCTSARDPFEPLSVRIRRLLHTSKLPLVTAGPWFRDAQLLGVEEGAGTISLDYMSCGAHADFNRCDNSLSIVVGATRLSLVATDLRGADCERFSVGGAPAVVWHKLTTSGDEAGIYVFSGPTVVTAAYDLTLESVSMSRVRLAAKALRPVGGATLPAPAYDAARLLGLCAKTTTATY